MLKTPEAWYMFLKRKCMLKESEVQHWTCLFLSFAAAKDVENDKNVENISVKQVGVSPSKKKKESRTLIDADENLSVKPVRNNYRRQTNVSPSQVKDSDTPVKNVRRLTGRKLLESPPRPPVRCLLPETPKTPKPVLQIHKQDSKSLNTSVAVNLRYLNSIVA